MMTTFLGQFGVLRGALVASAAIFAPLALTTGERAARSGWEMVPTLIVPAMAPIIFFVLAFDLMMSSILFGAHEGEKKARYRGIVVTEAIVLVALAAFWIPYFLSIGN
jgi:hypothetical protein